MKLSYTLPATFHAGSIPELSETLIGLLDPFFSKLALSLRQDDLNTKPTTTTFFDSLLFTQPDMPVLLERTLQILHIFRNFSSLEQNARYFTSFPDFLTILAKGNLYLSLVIKIYSAGIALPDATHYIEVRHHCIDIVEFIATHIQLRGHNDFYLFCYMNMVFENDRALILAAIRTLTRFCVHKGNQPILSTLDDDHIFQRLYQLLLVADEELVSAILDYIYQFSSLGTDVASKLALIKEFNSVKFLSKFLLWKGYPQPLAQPQVGLSVYYDRVDLCRRLGLLVCMCLTKADRLPL